MHGDLFVALRGEQFDAHDFLAQARVAGAAAALAERGLAEAGLPGLQVPDALAALAAAGRRLAPPFPPAADRCHRQQRQDHGDADDRLDPARRDGEAAFATEGNLNNHIGLPLTLLRLRATHRAAWSSWA